MNSPETLQTLRSQNIDITNFEEQMNDFKTGFARNYELASRKFQTAMTKQDDRLQKTKRLSFFLLRNLNDKAGKPQHQEAYEQPHHERRSSTNRQAPRRSEQQQTPT